MAKCIRCNRGLVKVDARGLCSYCAALAEQEESALTQQKKHATFGTSIPASDEIVVKTWNEIHSLKLSGDSLFLDYAGKQTVIPVSQVISFEVKDPKSRLRPGMIKISLPGSSGTHLLLTSFLAVGGSNNIEFPHGYDYLNAARQMQKRIANYNSSSGSAPQAASPADEIKKYKELLDMGAITQEEFDAKKRQLLGL